MVCKYEKLVTFENAMQPFFLKSVSSTLKMFYTTEIIQVLDNTYHLTNDER